MTTGRPPALSDSQAAQLRKMSALGFSQEDLAQRFRVDRATIRRHLGLNSYRPTTGHNKPYVPIVPLRMIVTPWFTDPADGLQTRVVRASE